MQRSPLGGHVRIMPGQKRGLPLVGMLVLVAAVAVPAHALAAATPAGSPFVRPAGFAPSVPHDAVDVGPVDGRQSVAFVVTLSPSHAAELASLLRAQNDPTSPRYQHWLARGEYQRRFGPDPAHVRAVMSWLHGVGFADARVADGGVEVHAPAQVASSALGVSFARYRTPDGTTSFASNAAPLVPRTLASDITAIVGLSNVPHLQPRHDVLTAPGQIHAALSPRVSCATQITQQANSMGGWTTQQVGTRYQVGTLLNAGLNGGGKTIAVYELAPHNQSDTSTYLACFGLHNAVTTRAVDGGAPDTNSGGVVEANLDVEGAAAIAPGAKIISYEGPNTLLGGIHVWSAIVNDDIAQSVSTSWGICEQYESTTERNALHSLFTQAAAQGQSIFAAAGDDGSEDCRSVDDSTGLAVDSPANEPLVTGVGGTSLKPGIAVTNPKHEPVWNDCQGAGPFGCFSGGAGGGGLSVSYGKPSWQPAAKASTCHPACREVPDIAANSGVGEIFYSGGTWSLIGGTSIASPKLAGIAADIVKGCAGPLGTFNRKVYALAGSGGIYGSALRDVPAGQGDNDVTGTNSHHYASANGYDLATGMGTPLATGLVCPEVARVTPAKAKAGTHVKITGLGLVRATVRFGNAAAKILTRTGSSATVVVPAGSGTVQVRGSGAMGKGTFHAAFTYKAG
jgi:kumamolisin